MRSSIMTLALLASASTAIAQPHRPHHERVHKRDANVFTEYEVVTETIDITTTIWVSSGALTASVAAASTSQGGQFFQPSVSAPAPTTSSSVYVAPPVVSTVAPAPTTLSSVYVAPPVVSTPVVVVPPPATTSQVWWTPTTSSVAPPATTTAAGGGGSSGSVCPSSSPCAGDITYYQAGLGACGETTDGDSEAVIALPWEMMGTQSNGNPYCGMTVTIMSGGKTTQATVVDKCMGCTGNSIDLSNKAFLALSELSVGRTDATWYFN